MSEDNKLNVNSDNDNLEAVNNVEALNNVEVVKKEEALNNDNIYEATSNHEPNFTLVNENSDRVKEESDYLTYNKEPIQMDGYSSWTKQLSSNRYERKNVSEDRKQPMENNQGNTFSNMESFDASQENESSSIDNYVDTEKRDDIWSIPPVQPLEYKANDNRNSSGTKKALTGLAMAVAFGVVAAVSFAGVNKVFSYFDDGSKVSSSVANNGDQLNLLDPKDPEKQIPYTEVREEYIQPKTAVTEVVENTMPSIVTIDSTFEQTYNWFNQEGTEDYEGGGSGFIVGENETELLIVTNNHVVADAKAISVTFLDDYKVSAEVKGTDKIADLAVLAIELESIPEETRNVIKVAKLGNSDNVKVGEMAIAIGNALGYGQSTTVGYIGAKDREVDVEDKTMVLLQTDAAINPGNSGGALLNINGEVIGINTVKYSSSEVEGMGFAIPISRAMPIVNELMTREVIKEEEKGYIGVMVSDVTTEQAELYGWPLGAYVVDLVKGGAGEAAGVLKGDIIIEVNGLEIESRSQLIDKVTSYRYGTDVKVRLVRLIEGKYVEKEFTLTLGKKQPTN